MFVFRNNQLTCLGKLSRPDLGGLRMLVPQGRTVAKADLTAHRTLDGMMRYNTLVFLSECLTLPPEVGFFQSLVQLLKQICFTTFPKTETDIAAAAPIRMVVLPETNLHRA